MFYVYQHSIPNTQRVFYVGKGSGKRAFSNKDRNIHWKNIVNKYGFTVDFVLPYGWKFGKRSSKGARP